MDNSSYSIEVNNQSYNIRCSDGEAHVREIENRLQSIIGELNPGGVPPNLSSYAIKVAITLADQSLKEEAERKKQEALIKQKFEPLLDQLDLLLGNQPVAHSGVANLG